MTDFNMATRISVPSKSKCSPQQRHLQRVFKSLKCLKKNKVFPDFKFILYTQIHRKWSMVALCVSGKLHNIPPFIFAEIALSQDKILKDENANKWIKLSILATTHFIAQILFLYFQIRNLVHISECILYKYMDRG